MICWVLKFQGKVEKRFNMRPSIHLNISQKTQLSSIKQGYIRYFDYFLFLLVNDADEFRLGLGKNFIIKESIFFFQHYTFFVDAPESFPLGIFLAR
jgi:hypothetical protein